MRLSKIQKCILTNVVELSSEYTEYLTIALKGFSPRKYYFGSRRVLMYHCFGDKYICKDDSGKKYIDRKIKDACEVSLSRSLKTLEEYGLIIRVGLWEMHCREPKIIEWKVNGHTEKILGKPETKTIGGINRVIDSDFNIKTQGIFLTDKGIVVRDLLLKEFKINNEAN